MAAYQIQQHAKHKTKDGGFASEILYVEATKEDGRKGSIEIEMCTECGWIVGSQCEHKEMKWNEEGTELRCTFCNCDGT